MSASVAPRIRKPRALTAKDRCDACSARAAIRVWMPSGLPLLFCLHHYAKHAKALKVQGARPEEEDKAHGQD